MPDFAACDQKSCPKASQCGRFLMVPSTLQSYISPTYEREGCYLFWDKKNVPFEIKKEEPYERT
jgi:hypothetical protein